MSCKEGCLFCAKILQKYILVMIVPDQIRRSFAQLQPFHITKRPSKHRVHGFYFHLEKSDFLYLLA